MRPKHTRKYTLEFKQQAVQLAKQLGSAKAAAEKLGIPEANVYSWRNNKKVVGSMGVNVSTGDAPEEEIKRLRKEVEDLKKVNYILKRAAAFFSQDQLK